MAVRFIIGRAGTGKTHHCLESIRDELRRDPIHGPRLIFLVPEQASLQMEQTILSSSDQPQKNHVLNSIHRVEVLSFQRLAYRVLNEASDSHRQALTEPARAMVLRHLLSQHANELQFYGRIAKSGSGGERVGGFTQKLNATITEFMNEALEPDDLVALTQNRIAADRDDPAQAAKIHDLQIIYKSYLDYLGTERFDPSQHLQLARESMSQCSWLSGAHLWVDGFASFSGQELRMLIDLMRVSAHADITVLLDPSVCDQPPTQSSAQSPQPMFSKTYRTYRDLYRSFLEAGLQIEDPLRLTPGSPPRFPEKSTLTHLEKHWGKTVPGDSSSIAPSIENIELIELPSRRAEVDYALSRVCRWIQDAERKYRYRDIAIIVRDLEPYHDLLTQSLTAHDIPFFIDRRRPVSHHPLIELIRSAVLIAEDQLSLASVRAVLKTNLLPVSMEEADELENYLIEHGLQGLKAWRGEDWTFFTRSSFTTEHMPPSEHQKNLMRRVNDTRRKLLGGLDGWMNFSMNVAHDGSEWSKQITELLETLQVGKTLREWSQQAQADGDLDQAEEHQQVWVEMMSFLDDLAFAFDETKLTISELADVFEAGLSQFSLGLIPPTLDQVLVGSIDRSRNPDIKAAIILGFNDGVFPVPHSEDSILNDDDRTLMQESGLRIGPPTRERVVDESMLVYIAMTRASKELVVTYAVADQDGKALRPSPYLQTLRACCATLEVQSVSDPTRSRDFWDILNTNDLIKRLSMEFRYRPAISEDQPTLRGRWNELYSHTRIENDPQVTRRFAFSSLDDPPQATLSTSSIERLYAGPFKTSVSQLETYATCPFQYFSRYMLRLKERVEAELTPLDVGQVHHAILEDFVKAIATKSMSLDGLNESAMMDQLRESCSRVSTLLPESGAISDARNLYLLRRSATHLAKMIRAQQKVAGSGSSRPKSTELPFGFDQPGSLPAFELSTPSGRKVFLRGYIDRVDLAELGDELLGVVIDYKRTRDKSLKLDTVYHGLSLQLIGYLLVLAEYGQTLTGRPIRPIGALYVSSMTRYHKVDHPNRELSRDATLRGTYRPRGLLNTDLIRALDDKIKIGWSDHYSVYIGKNGQPGYIDASDAADKESFQHMMEHTKTKLGELADGILDGCIQVNPYRLGNHSPCSWCSMVDVCRFEMGISDVRFLESLKRSEVFTRLGVDKIQQVK